MEVRDKLKDSIKEIVKEVMVESFRPEGAGQEGQGQGRDVGGGRAMTDDEWDEATEEARERKIPISQTRTYKRVKARERRSDEDEDEESGIQQRGQVTDPQHDRRLKRNRDTA
jgi:hypothetical protein